jgi:poly(A) polymerase
MTSVAAETWFSAPALTRVFNLLNADGGEVRVVGGAVRNSLMGLPVADIDMATTLLPQEVVARAKKAGIKSITGR